MPERFLLPGAILLLVICALCKRLPVYDLFLAGCRAGLKAAVDVLPNLLCMMVAIAFWESAGLGAALANACAPVFRALGLPPELAPLAFLRPLSGSASLAMLQQLMAEHGPDSRVGLIACTLMGSSETILYTVCVYLGAIREKRSRYAVPCALLGMLAALLLAGAMFCD